MNHETQNITAPELEGYLDKAIPILNILKRFIPGTIDDRGVEYVQAFRDSGDLLRLVAEDITAIGGIEAIIVQPDGTLSIASDPNVPEGAEAARQWDGSRLKKLFEMAPMLFELFKMFKGLPVTQ